jgi:hypothetical protein
MTCTCGIKEPHVIAKRQSADGKSLHIWSDGCMTYWHGQYFGNKKTTSRKVLKACGAEFLCLYTTQELLELFS